MSWVAKWRHTGRIHPSFFWRIYTSLMCQSRVLRDLTIRQRRRQWKRRWKIAPASFQTISSSSYLKQGTLCWSWRERATPEFKQRWWNLSPCRSRLQVWSFHAAEQETGKNVQKSVTHLLHFDAVVAVVVASFVRSLNIPEIACKWQNHSFTWMKYDSQKVYQPKLNFEKTVRLISFKRPFAIRFNLLQSCSPFLFCCYYLYFFLHFFWGVIVLFFIHFSGGSHYLNFDKLWDPVPPERGGEVIPGNSWWGCAAWFSKSLPYFRPQHWHFPQSFSDLGPVSLKSR